MASFYFTTHQFMDKGELRVDFTSKITAKTNGQKRLFKVLKNPTPRIVGVFGPSGTGKSMISLVYGIDSVLKGVYSKLVISRPLVDVETSSELTLLENSDTWLREMRGYLRDLVYRYIDLGVIEDLESKGKIVYVHPHLLRGRSFDGSLIIMDDVQNVTPQVITEIILRLGENSRLIIIGDPILQARSENAAKQARSLLLGEIEGTEVVDMGLRDIVRPGARLGIKLLLESHMRSRDLSETEREVYTTASRIAPDASIITVLDLRDLKEIWGITAEHVPDSIIVVKEGHLPRLIGSGGERINKIEEETGLKIRGVELSLDFTGIVKAIHPVPWVHKHVRKTDLIGSDIVFVVSRDGIGAFIGQKGFYAKFIEEALKRLLGVGVRVEEPVPPKKKRG